MKGTNNWDPKEFFDRWFMQQNYPLVYAQLIDAGGGLQQLQVTQSRALNTNFSIFPNPPYNNTYKYILYFKKF
jgi:hypothetical protein